MRSLFFAILFFCVLAALVFATDYRYVTADADGSGDGTSSTTPWTLSQAVSGAAGDMVVYVKEGTYNRTTSDSPAGDGTAVNTLYWIGCNQDWTPIIPSRSVTTGLLDTSDYPVFTYSSGRFYVNGMIYAHIRCIKVVCDAYTGPNLQAPGGTIVDSCVSVNNTNNAAAGAFSTGGACIAINNDFACTSSSPTACVSLSNSGATFYGNVIYDAPNTGLSVSTGYAQYCVSNNLIYGVDGACIEFTATANWSPCPVINCTLYGGTYGVKFTTSNQVTSVLPIINCAIFGQSIAPIYSGCTDGFPALFRFSGFDGTSFSMGGTWDLFHNAHGNNTVTNASPTDIIFKAPATGDFRLRNNSPLIGSSYTAYNDIGYMQTGNMPSVENVYAVTVNGETGTLVLPTVAQVLYNVLYGPGGDSFAGSYHGPATADVKENVLYGPDNTYEGEYVGSGSGSSSKQQIPIQRHGY